MVEEEEKKDKKGEKREEVLQTVKSLLADHFFQTTMESKCVLVTQHGCKWSCDSDFATGGLN